MKPANGWIDYWSRDDFWGRLRLWDLNSRVFMKRAEGTLEFSREDAVLDIGSGPGELACKLSGHVRSVLAVDTSPQFVEMTRERCRGLTNVEAALTGEDYTDLTVFGRKFSLFLCISVVQYYNTIGEVEALIRSARTVALPGARMLIADLNLKRGRAGFLYDALCSVWAGVRDGYASDLLRMAWKRWGGKSGYRQVHDAGQLLTFAPEDIQALMKRTGVKARIIRRSFSIYANRPSLLIYF